MNNDKRFPSNSKVALITGITGQDGSYLAEMLLEKGCDVHGVNRRPSSFNTERIDHIYQDPHLKIDGIGPCLKPHYGDLSDSSNLTRINQQVQPVEGDNLRAQSHVAVSFESSEDTNLYGPGDNYHRENSQVIPALIRRFHEAKMSEASEPAIWGTGKPRREFLYVDDMAAASVFVMQLPLELCNSKIAPMSNNLNIGSVVMSTSETLLTQ